MVHRLDTLALDLTPQVIAWRRHLHANPELSFQEKETGNFIADVLGKLEGIEISRPSGNCVVGRLRGGKPGPVLALRADFDALPIVEETGLPFASQWPGVMHACGHDGHTSILLGVATSLSRLRGELAGEIRFLFEEGEEAAPGGAVGMVRAGVMDGVDRVMGLHLWSPLEIGTIQVNTGPVMAACDDFTIEIHGRGGHIGAPHKAIDPIAIGAQIVTNLQHVIAREINPVEAGVVGVTQFHAGKSVGVIPETAIVSGGANTFSNAVRDTVERRVGEIARGICAAHGATCSFTYNRVYDAVLNEATTARTVRQVSNELFGASNTVELPPIMPGEDFSAFANKAPGCFVLFGAGNVAKGITAAHHDPKFDIDEDALPMAMRLFLHSAIRFQNGQAGLSA